MPHSVPSEAKAAFLAGYRAAGGPLQWERHFIEVVIPCEGHWQLDPPGYHLGLLQFDPRTWESCARPGADYRDPFEQGWCAAAWVNMGVDPGGTGGWGYCWWQ